MPRASYPAPAPDAPLIPTDSGLLGRHRECEYLDGLVTNVRSGRSEVRALRGEAGIGKSALLHYVAENSNFCRVVQIAGVESEMELAFAGLHRLCAPLLNRLDGLPDPQRQALAIAFGNITGKAPDRFLIALAALNLLTNAAEELPLVCLIDDAQWLDQASAQSIGFVARRLHAEPIALLFALRGTEEDQALTGLEEFVIGGLSDTDAHRLLASALTGPLDEQVRSRIVAEARGNPLALLELPRGLTSVELSYGFGVTGPALLSRRIEQSYLRSFETLPDATRLLLLIAAVEPVGDVTLLVRAARQLGIPPDATAAATAAGVIDIGTHVRFRHPLVRPALCRAASVDEIREAHSVLADITDAERDPDRLAWHRAHAATGPDDGIAADLKRSVDRARTRGGVGAAAAFLERAAELTSDPSRNARLALEAAQARHQAGAFDAALALLGMAEAGPLSNLQRAQADLVRARVTSALSRGRREAPALLLKVAQQLEPLDLKTARDTYLAAFVASFSVRPLAAIGTTEIAKAVRNAPQPREPRTSDLLLDGWASLFTDGCQKGLPLLKRAVESFCADELAEHQPLQVLPPASAAAMELMDDEAWDILSARYMGAARETGTISELPPALHCRVLMHVHKGELSVASSLISKMRTADRVTGSKLWPYGAVVLAAWEGRESKTGKLARAELNDLVARGEGAGMTILNWADALLANAHGQYHDAVPAATRAIEDPNVFPFRTWSMVEFVEAASRDNMKDLTVDVLEKLSLLTQASGTDWALGIEARSRALVSADDDAEHYYREATNRLDRTLIHVEAARAHLVYGEWLRRQNRRIDAREELRTAHNMFTTMGVHAFAERARRELTATGETLRRRTKQNSPQLTDQQAQIARLAGDGLTNPEIGAELFISPRTVEWHLRKIFSRLGVTSRRQLPDAIPR